MDHPPPGIADPLPQNAPSGLGRGAPWGGRAADILCLLILLGCNVALRWNWLGVLVFNPDESEYVSVAAFVLAHRESPCHFPNADLAFTVALYELVAALFGPYQMLPLRVLTLAISFLLAALVYAILRRHTNLYYALFGGMLFSLYNITFEGLSANREWFSMLPLFAAICLCDRACGWQSSRRRLAAAFAAGCLGGVAIWFKDQSIVLAQAIPLWLLGGAVQTRQWRGALQQVGAYVVGGMLAGVVYFAAFASAGTLAEHFLVKFNYGGQYAFVQNPYASAPPRSALYYYFVRGPHAEIIVIAALCAGLVLLRMAWQVYRRRPPRAVIDQPAARLCALQFALGLYVVQMGQRYFFHYYLFLMPSLAVLFSLAFWQLSDWGSRLRPQVLKYVPCAAALILVLRLFPITPCYRPLDNLFESECAEIRGLAQPGDRLFVWGWQPMIYSCTGLEPATRYTTCRVIANDYGSVHGRPVVNQSVLAVLLAELEADPPRFFVDAAPASYAMTEQRQVYRLEFYPELRQFLTSRYRLIRKTPQLSIFELANRRAAQASSDLRAGDGPPGGAPHVNAVDRRESRVATAGLRRRLPSSLGSLLGGPPDG